MICVSISENSFEEAIKSISDAKFAELRLDLCNISENDLKRIYNLDLNTIATCRKGKFSEKECVEKLINSIMLGVKYIDIDYEFENENKLYLHNIAKKNNCKTINSYHNFDNTPDYKQLVQIAISLMEQNPDIIKIACKSNNQFDNEKILKLYKQFKNIIAIGMGNEGKITRILATKLGAPFTFAYPAGKQSTAHGQIDYDTLNEILKND